MQAVILAAGHGSRIREFHQLPKGFIQLHETTLIKQSIEKLNACGVYDILIVTGYGATHYDAFATEINQHSRKKQIDTCFNPKHDCYGSLFSLYCAKDWVKKDFLILESDIIYEQRAIDIILHDPHPNTILLSGETGSTDEVYVQVRDHKLVRMSKEKNHLALDEIAGEFVGINKVSLRDFRQLTHQLEQHPSLLHTGHYEEQGLVAITAFSDIFCLKIADLLWSEIDDYFHYERAKKIEAHIRSQSSSITAHEITPS